MLLSQKSFVVNSKISAYAQ